MCWNMCWNFAWNVLTSAENIFYSAHSAAKTKLSTHSAYSAHLVQNFLLAPDHISTRGTRVGEFNFSVTILKCLNSFQFISGFFGYCLSRFCWLSRVSLLFAMRCHEKTANKRAPWQAGHPSTSDHWFIQKDMLGQNGPCQALTA